MNPLRVVVRFPVTDAPEDLEPAIAVFHRFIQRGLVEGLILDVADYRHVPTGPGVMLIGHDVDYGVNPDEYTVVRKRSKEDDAATQLRDALRMGLGSVRALEVDGGLGVTVDRSSFTVSVHDRVLGDAPDVAEQLMAEIEPLVTEIYGSDATVEVVHHDDPRQAPVVRVKADAEAAAAALDALGGSRAPHQSPWDIAAPELVRLRDSEDDLIVLDVREENEYGIVNIGGRLAPLAELGDHVEDLDRDAKVVVHCRAGIRGAEAVKKMREAGFTDVWNLNGGLMAWIDEVDPSLPKY